MVSVSGVSAPLDMGRKIPVCFSGRFSCGVFLIGAVSARFSRSRPRPGNLAACSESCENCKRWSRNFAWPVNSRSQGSLGSLSWAKMPRSSRQVGHGVPGDRSGAAHGAHGDGQDLGRQPSGQPGAAARWPVGSRGSRRIIRARSLKPVRPGGGRECLWQPILWTYRPQGPLPVRKFPCVQAGTARRSSS